MELELSTPKTRRESEVWQACDDLWAQTSSVRQLTGDSIRDQLLKLGYKRGSPNEIYRYRNSWKDSRGISDGHDNNDVSEIKSSDPISRAVGLVYEQMRSQTQDSIAKLTEDYEDQLKASLIEEETLRESLKDLEDKSTSLNKELISALAHVAELERLVGDEKQGNRTLNEKLMAAQQHFELLKTEHGTLILELKGFHEREIDLWRTQGAELTRTMAELRKQSQAEIERQGAVFSEELMGLRTVVRQTVEEREQVRAKAALLEDTVKELRRKAETLEDERRVLSKDAAGFELERELFKHSLQSEKKEKIRWQRIVERYLGTSKRIKEVGRRSI